MRILLIEDDTLIGDGLKNGLTHLGYTVDWFLEGDIGRQAMEMASYDAAVLDLTLPKEDGLVILKKWRDKGFSTPVIVLTARDAISDRVKGLDLGADDYLGKPFSLEELVARLRALLRRSHNNTSSVLTCGNVSFDSASKTLTKNGELVKVSPKALQIIELFLMNPKKVLSKSQLEEKLYAWGEEVSSNAVEVHVHHIRKKLGNEFIKTVHGLGYVLGNA